MKIINLQPISKNAKVISGFAFKSSEFMDIGIPVVKITNVKKESITLEDCQFVDRKYLSLNEKYKINNGDVLIALTGSHLSQPNSVVGRIARYHYKEMSLLNQRVGKLFIHGKNNLDLIFLYYYLVQDKVLYSLALNAKGSANQANISPSDVERILIPAFTLSSQKVIVDILSSYDELIDTNRRRIRLLEESARLLFREWFVYFRFPGYEKVKIVDGVPEGWEKEKINKIVAFKRGVEPGSDNYLEEYEHGLFPFIRISDLTTRDPRIFIDEQYTKEAILKREDIAVSLDGSVGIVSMGLEGCYSSGIRKLVVKDKKINTAYLYFLMKSHYIQGVINAYAKGTTIQHAGEAIKHIITVLPKQELMDMFGDVAGPAISEMLVLMKQSQKLAQARDLLLPRLMSGAIEV